MSSPARLRRTAFRAAQHPLNAAALAGALGGALWSDNPLPVIFYALSFSVTLLALWNWGAWQGTFAREDAEAGQRQAVRDREELAAWLGANVQLFAGQGYRTLRPVLRDYEELHRRRDEIARLAKERQEVNLSSETEIVRRVDGMLDAYLTLAHKHLVYLGLLGGVRLIPRGELDGLTPRIASIVRAGDRALPSLGDRLAELDRQHDMLEGVIARLPEGSANREARTHQLKTLENRRRVFEEAARNHESVPSQLDAIKSAFVFLVDRMAATDLVAEDISGYLESAATDVDQTLNQTEAVRLDPIGLR